MLIFNEINVLNQRNKSGKEKFQNGFDSFFDPMQKIPFFGDNYNTIVPILISVIGLASTF